MEKSNLKPRYLLFFGAASGTFVLAQLFLLIFSRQEIFEFKNEKFLFFFEPPFIHILLAVFLALFLAFSLWQIKKGVPALNIFSLALIFGGGSSNLVDRLNYGGVVDYLNLGLWQINLADIFIILGVVIFCLSFIRPKQKKL